MGGVTTVKARKLQTLRENLPGEHSDTRTTASHLIQNFHQKCEHFSKCHKILLDFFLLLIELQKHFKDFFKLSFKKILNTWQNCNAAMLLVKDSRWLAHTFVRTVTQSMSCPYDTGPARWTEQVPKLSPSERTVASGKAK